MPTIDFNDAMAKAKNAAARSGLLPAGDYDMICIEATPTMSSTNKPMINTVYQVESGPHAGSKMKQARFTFSADSDVALRIFFRHMACHGLDTTFFAANPPWEQVAASMVNRRCQMRLGVKKLDSDFEVNELLSVMPPTSPGAVAPAPQQMQPQQMQPAPQFQQPMQQPQPQPQQAPQPQFAQPQQPQQPQVQQPAPVQQPMQPQPQPVQPAQQPVQQPAQQPVQQPVDGNNSQVQQQQPDQQQYQQPQVPQPVQENEQQPAPPDVPF